MAAKYLPGVHIVVADFESKHHNSSAEWELNQKVFEEVIVEVDPEYERRTSPFKQVPQASNNPNPLLLSYVKPHKPVSSQRIAHWLNNFLALAGVDTSVFKAHSTRGASASAAKAKGAALEDILQVADWANLRVV